MNFCEKIDFKICLSLLLFITHIGNIYLFVRIFDLSDMTQDFKIRSQPNCFNFLQYLVYKSIIIFVKK